MRFKLKETPDDLEAQGVIVLVTIPTRWISFIVAVPRMESCASVSTLKT